MAIFQKASDGPWRMESFSGHVVVQRMSPLWIQCVSVHSPIKSGPRGARRLAICDYKQCCVVVVAIILLELAFSKHPHTN